MVAVVVVVVVVVDFCDVDDGGGNMTPVSCILLVGILKHDKKMYAHSIQIILKICTLKIIPKMKPSDFFCSLFRHKQSGMNFFHTKIKCVCVLKNT